MRRRAWVAVVAALLAVACGGEEGATGGSASEPGASEASEPEAGGESESGATEAASGGAAADLGTVRVAVGAAQSIEFAAAQLGVELGVWEERGLEVENISVSGGGEVARTMAAGEADIGLTGGPGAVTPIVKGLEASLVAATSLDYVGLVIAVGADSDIQEVADLEGATMGFTSFGSLTDFATRKIAESQGWTIGEELQAAPIGGITELMAALQQGSIDAFTWSPEAVYELEGQGEARIIGDLGEIVGDNVFEAAYATDELINDRPEALEAYLSGYFEAVQYMKDNEEEAIQYMVDTFGLSEYAIMNTYEISIDNLSTTGEIPEANLQGLAESLPQLDEEITEAPPVEEFWDPSFVPVSE